LLHAAEQRAVSAEQRVRDLTMELNVARYQLAEALAFGQNQQKIAYDQGQMANQALAQVQHLQDVIAFLRGYAGGY